MLNKRKIIGVMGSGTYNYVNLAKPLGQMIAKSNYHLLTGGGSGVMSEVSKAFCQTPQKKGLSIGILKSKLYFDDTTKNLEGKIVTPNEWIEIPIYTHLPYSGERGMDTLSRNHINVLTSDILIALPGGAGTYSEVMLRLKYGKDVIFYIEEYNIAGRKQKDFFEMKEYQKQIFIAKNIEDIERFITNS